MKTHINDTSAHALGFRFAVMSAIDRCVGYYRTAEEAMAAAKRIRGSKILHITSRKSQEVLQLERNGYKIDPKSGKSGVKRNPLQDFDFPPSYVTPRGTLERVRESMAPGLRWVAGQPKHGVQEETTWPIPDIHIPAPKGLNYLPHQIAGIASMLHKKNVLLADEQGLGKTIEIIGYMNCVKPDRTLIACPTIAVENWYDELKLWLIDKNAKILIFAKPKKIVSRQKRKGGGKYIAQVAGADAQFCVLERVILDGNECTIYTPVRDSENPDWNVAIVSYQTFKVRAGISERAAGAIIATEKKKDDDEEEEIKPRVLPTKARDMLRNFESRGGLDLLVLDEVHTIKKPLLTPPSYWHMAMFGEPSHPSLDSEPYEGLSRFAKRNIFASGTPVVNKHPVEMFPALNALDRDSFPTERLFTEEFGGRKIKTGKKTKAGKEIIEIGGAENEAILGIKLRDTVLIRRKADDVLELPILRRLKLPIRDTPEVKEARRLEAEAAKVDEDDLDGVDLGGNDLDEDDAAASNDQRESEADDVQKDSDDPADDSYRIGMTEEEIVELLSDESLTREERVELNKALRSLESQQDIKIISSGGNVQFHEIMRARVAMGIAKAKQFDLIFKEVVEMTEGNRISDKFVIFYKHQKCGNYVVDRLINKLGYKEDQIVRIDGNSPPANRGDSVNAFKKNPNVKIFLATLETCSTAITLLCSNVSIFMETDYRPAWNLQAEKRTHRFGPNLDTKFVYELYPFAPRSIDAAVFAVIEVKSRVQAAIFDTFPTEKTLEDYEKKFKISALHGVKYSLDQRVRIKEMLETVIKNYEKAKKNKDEGEVLAKINLSWSDPRKLEVLKREFESKSYPGKPEKSETFPEELIDRAMPVLWAMRKFALPSMFNGGRESIEFPSSITGLERHLFKPITGRNYNYKSTGSKSEDNYLHQLLYLATLPIRSKMYQESRRTRVRRPAGETTEELTRIANEDSK